MTPNEILKQAFERINNRTKKVVYPVTKYCDIGLGMPIRKDDLKNIPLGSYCKLYEHRYFQTKPYRDESSAAYKLIRFMEVATVGAEEIYWRFKPEVLQHMDFDMLYPQYKGRVRFSVFGKNGEPI